MALKFTVSAPGKVILHGEHSVVYGKPALASVIGLRNYLTLEANNKTHLILQLDSLKKQLNYDLDIYNGFLKKMTEKYHEQITPSNINHNEFLDCVREFVKQHTPPESIMLESHEKSLWAIFYLLTGILMSNGCVELNYGFTLTMKSEITIGAGLGSSASYAVCLASAFYFYAMVKISSKFITNFNNRSTIEEQNNIKKIITDWAFCSEKIMHGNPSGIDNTICTFGGFVKFRKGTETIFIEQQNPLNMILANTGVSRSSATLVQKVALLKETFPQLVEYILNAMGALVDDVAKILENMEAVNNEHFKKLENLVCINNNLLRSIGVSHSSLEKIFSISEKYGFSSKLTGAGGGGYATILLPFNYVENENFAKLCDDLNNNNFQFNVTSIGGKGMEVTEDN